VSAFERTTVIEVRAWGQRVGAVADGGLRGAYTFEYDPAWVRTGIELAPILMPLSGTRRSRRFSFPGMSQDTFKGLPPAIADALPDRFGNALVDAWLAQEGIPAAGITALDRLAYLGERGLGALTFSPAHTLNGPPPTALNLSDLIVAARDVVHGTLNTEDEARSALRQIIDVGTSAGGARAKAVVNINDETHEIRAGHTMPQPGYSAWLLKFDGIGADRELGTTQDYGRIERAYALMAAAAGIVVPDTGLIHENGRAHFITKRFDRVGAGRLHMQSLCGLAGLDFNEREVHDYSQLFNAIDQLTLGQNVKQEAFRRMVFNVAAANNDDHTKNHSFLMDSDGAWSLSPAYDVTHAYNPKSIWTSQHLMSVNGKFSDATFKDFVAVAERHGVERATSIITEVNDAVVSWSEHAEAAGVPAAAQAEVAADLRSIRR
jgi:serine/threonine-protein kinase HipA